MTIHIREATPDDADGIIAVFNPIIETGKHTAFTEPFTAEAEREFIENLPERAIFHVAVQQADDKIVGFQSLEPFSAYISAFDHVAMVATFVDLGHQRQGIAAQLFEATFAAARQKGFEKIHTFVRADNIAGLRAYLGQGFRIVGSAHRQAKINGQYIDEINIERFL